MCIDRKKEDVSRYLLRAFHLFVVETDLEAIQSSYFLSVIKALNAQLLKSKIKCSL